MIDFTRFHNRLVLKGTLRLETPLRIGTGRAGDATMADITVVKDAAGAPYIPGSSFKGVLRSHLEAVLRAINEDYACLCVTERKGENTGCPTTRDSKLLGEQIEALKREIAVDKKPADALDAFFFDQSCWVCQVFGSPWLASKVQIKDLLVKGEWLGRYQLRDGVAIDRDTETASEGKLYTFEAVPAGTEFTCEIIIENADEAEQGMVLLGLKAFEPKPLQGSEEKGRFEAGRVCLGGGRSRGLGRVSLTWDECWEVDGTNPTALLNYLITGEAKKLDPIALDDKISAFRRKLGV